ncbi:HNH endonuclease [Streptomyces massasporeus]|uniref:HNH endonuclease n=1 Tax=Streptomyces massasporeus TaxID=67324 RepID=UPI0036FCFED0
MPEATRPASITCARCGTEKKVGRSGPIPTYCSAVCRNALSNERARTDGRYEKRLARERQQAAAQRENNSRPCPYCGSLMTNPRRVQCGAPECKRQFTNDRMREYQRQYREKHGYFQSRLYDRGRKKQYAITCIQCGRDAAVTKATSRFCSRDCWYEAKRLATAQAHSQIVLWRRNRHPLRIQIIRVRKPLRRRWYSACCPMCATWFVTDNPLHQHCSSRCGKRAAKDRRRALEREAFVSPVSRTRIFERDRWTCQLCGKRVKRDAVVPDPMAPVLDHVLPLARGGTHEPANAQLAHYRCNSLKSDSVWGDGEQLALIG